MNTAGDTLPEQATPPSVWPPWVNLPRDLTADILGRLSVKDIFRCELVCTTWQSVCLEPSMWRFVDLDVINCPPLLAEWDEVCREVVNRSKGQLLSIKLGGFATDDLLYFIAQRAKQLRCLIIGFGGISDEGFAKAIKEFSMLEELELNNCTISRKVVEAAGHCCPLLKSFSQVNQYIDVSNLDLYDEHLYWY